MYKPYATEEELCNLLANYKTGDEIIFIRDKGLSNEGIIETGTHAKIIGVRIKNGIKKPEVFADEISDYYANADEYVFSYNVELEDSIQVYCSSEEIVTETDFKDDIDKIIKRKRRECRTVLAQAYLLKVLLPCLHFLIFVFAIFIPISSLFTAARDENYSFVLLFALIILCVMIFFSWNFSFIADFVCAPIGRIKKKRKRKHILTH